MYGPASDALRSCEVLRGIIDAVGPCKLAPRKDYFVALCEAIVSQQLSIKAAATIFRRFRELFDRKRPTPEKVLALTDEQLRSCGLSNQKLGYVRDLARKFADGTVPRRGIAKMTDDEVIEALTRVKGIGVWTAQMFLIFVLGRLDVWPTDDLGIRRAVQINFGYEDFPPNGELMKVAEPWRPYRSVAAWYLWQSLAARPPAAKE